MLTKKHFKAIAEILRENTTLENIGTIQAIIPPLSQYFRSENPAFSKDRFLSACKNNELGEIC